MSSLWQFACDSLISTYLYMKNMEWGYLFGTCLFIFRSSYQVDAIYDKLLVSSFLVFMTT